MAESEDYRIPCNRCGDPVLLSAGEYEQTDGEAYCQDCLVSFTCPSCGERKNTIPENISSEGDTYCASCGLPGGPSTGQSIARAIFFAGIIGVPAFLLTYTGSIDGAIEFATQSQSVTNLASVWFFLGIYAFK